MKRNANVATFLLALFALAAPSLNPVFAQSATTSALAGSVEDESGKPLAGVVLQVSNTATGAQFTVTTKENGRYSLPGLQPGGPYRVTVAHDGFSTQVRDGLNLAMSQTLRVDFTLGQDAFVMEGLESFTVRDHFFTGSRQGTAGTVGSHEIARLPNLTRDFTDFSRLIPQLHTRGALTSAAGRNSRFNSIQIDGALNNDLFGLSASGTPGGQAGGRPIPIEAIQEFQVVVAPFDVRQSGFTGAGINAITRSGTNDFTGTLGYYTRDAGLVGKYKHPKSGELSEAVSDFTQQEVGFSLAGPVIQDRVHFFLAGELSQREAPVGTVAGVNSTISRADADRVAEAIRNLYGFDPGTAGPVSLGRRGDNLFARLDFTLSENHRLTVRHNFLHADDENLRRDNSRYALSRGGYEFHSSTQSTVGQLNSTFKNKYFNELRIGRTAVRDQRVVGSEFPSLRVYVPGGSVMVGADQFSAKNALDQDVFDLTNDLTFSTGAHTVTAGVNFQQYAFRNLFVRNAFGYYEFRNVDDLIAGRPSRYEYSYQMPGGKERAEFGLNSASLYAQDQWQVSDRLTLTGGVRLERSELPTPIAHNDQVSQTVTRHGEPVRTDEVPHAKWTLNPRVGFNWDVTGELKTQLRGGVGLFTGNVPGVWLSNPYGNTGLDYARFTCRGSRTPGFTVDPFGQPQSCAGTTQLATNEINTIDPHFQLPQVFRGSLAVDQRLPMGFIGSLEGLFTQARSDAYIQDLLVGEAVGEVEGRPVFDRSDAPFSNVSDLTNTAKPYSYSVTAQLQRSFAENWSTGAAYTFSRSFDVNSMTSSQAYSNYRFVAHNGHPNEPDLSVSNFDVPHRVQVYGTYTKELVKGAPTDVSFIYVGSSGRPYSYTYAGDVNGDRASGNDMIFVPRDPSEIRFPAGDTESWANLDAFINQVPCLAAARGTVLKRNACREPWANRIDVRVAQNIPSFRDQNLQLTVDVLNFGNLLNSGWGITQEVDHQAEPLLRPNTRRAPVNGRYEMAAFGARDDVFEVSDFNSRYQVQIGVRYVF